MCSGLQGDEASRYLSKGLLHRFRCRRYFLFQNDFACFLQNFVPPYLHSANLLHRRSPFCASIASFIGSVSHPAGRPAFSSHLISRVTGKVKTSEIHLDGKGVNQELTVDSTDMALPA